MWHSLFWKPFLAPLEMSGYMMIDKRILMKNDQRAMIVSRESLAIKEYDSHDMLLLLLIVPLIFTHDLVMSLIGHIYCA